MSLSFNPNFEFISSNNSSTANLGAGASFTGTADDIRDIDVVNVVFFATQNCTLVLQQSPDGTNWDIQDSFTYTANSGFSTSVTAVGLFYRLVATNNGGSATTSLRLQSQYSSGLAAAPRSLGQKVSAESLPVVVSSNQTAIPSSQSGAWTVSATQGTSPWAISAASLPLPTGAATETTLASRLADATFTARINTLGQKVMASSTPVVLASDQSNINVAVISTPSPTPEASGFEFGQVTLASITEVILRKAAYTEQTSNAQRSIKSSSANDAAAGTGVRTVQITYYTATGTGPFTETLTLNGITGVNTVATDICYIDKMTALTVGSGNAAAGNITMQSATAGGGVVIKQISTGDLQSFDAVHYVAAGTTLYISGISAGHNGTTVGSGARYRLRRQTLNAATQPLIQVSDFVRLYGQSSTFSRIYQAPIIIAGPAKLELWVLPETASSTIYYGSFDYFTR